MSADRDLVHVDFEDQCRLTLAELQLRMEGIAELPVDDRPEQIECALITAFVVGARYGRHLERRVADKERGNE